MSAIDNNSLLLGSYPRPLSAKFECDFAYPTVKDRMPVILTKVVDTVFRSKNEVVSKYGQSALQDVKDIVGHLSRLKNELQTNKPMDELTDSLSDVDVWNAYLQSDTQRLCQESTDSKSSWFSSAWLYVECYFYRRILSAIKLTRYLKEMDPYRDQKNSAFTESMLAISTLAHYLTTLTATQTNDLTLQFKTLFYVALWGNKCDLSISAGSDNHQTVNPLTQLETLTPFILCDDTDRVWQHLRDIQHKERRQLDIVLDNAGFELFTDLCLADFLISNRLVDVVVFHAKCIPWFVSDVTPVDWSWTLDELVASGSSLSGLGESWKARLAAGSWVFRTHSFWTLPYDFSSMKSVAPDLWSELSRSDLIVFKGDLNYRKLTGDLKWDPTTAFETSLRGFSPAPLCSLRTLKSDLIVGLQPGQAENTAISNSDWMLTGTYAVIQYFSNSML